MEKFDLIILGGGAAGFAAAARASELGATAAMINSGLPIGGTCVNVGCVPSKFLLEVGEEFFYSRRPRFRAIPRRRSRPLDFGAVVREKEEIIAALRESNYTRVIENLPGVSYIEGKASFVSVNEVEVKGRRLWGEKFVIATGSRPRVLPFPGIERVHYITSREALSLPQLPRSMVVIGAGAVGLEIAQMYAHFGSRVTVLEKEKQVLPAMEPEIAEELERCLVEEGMAIHTGAEVDSIREEGGVKIVEARWGASLLKVEGEELLLAAGVVPNTEGLGLEVAGVQTDRRGFILVDDILRTSAPHIWAAGDVVEKTFLETVAAKEGYLVASNSLEGAGKSVDYRTIPRAVFTSPQVAAVGLTEAETMQRHNTCSCRVVKIAQVPRARAIKETRGLIKMVAHPENLRVLGVHIVSPLAADIIHEAALAVKFQLTIDDIIDTVHVFPTMSEAIKLVAQSFRRDITRMSCCIE